MNIQDIQTSLNNPDFQYRLKGIAALKDHTPEVAVPLLTRTLHDPEFLVRSFVAMGLGKQRTAESFAALLEMMKLDNTPNVRAEAANSLAQFGTVAAAHLSAAFVQDKHWLVRRSILAALMDLECHTELLEVCLEGIAGEDLPVQEAAIAALGTLAGTTQQEAALVQLLILADSEAKQFRIHAAKALTRFNDPRAQVALNQLRQDSEHQVVAATLEELLP